MKKKVKLTKRDIKRMWGDDTPYSQVNLREESRILGGGVSRVFLVVDAEMNPFTFEFVLSHKEVFQNDPMVIQFLQHAEYRGEEFGYVVSAGQVLVSEPDALVFAEEQRAQTIGTVIRMHTFVIEYFGLQKKHDREDSLAMEDNGQFVWNPITNQIETATEDVWEEGMNIESPSGIIGDKIRYFLILEYSNGVKFSKKVAETFSRVLKDVENRKRVVVEDIESFKLYMSLVVLIPTDVTPDDFVHTLHTTCLEAIKNEFFKDRYLITNTGRPTQKDITQFLGRLPE